MKKLGLLTSMAVLTVSLSAGASEIGSPYATYEVIPAKPVKISEYKKQNHADYLEQSAKLNPGIEAVFGHTSEVSMVNGVYLGDTVFARTESMYGPERRVDLSGDKPGLMDFNKEDWACYVRWNSELRVDGFTPDKAFAIVHSVADGNPNDGHCLPSQPVLIKASDITARLSTQPMPPLANAAGADRKPAVANEEISPSVIAKLFSNLGLGSPETSAQASVSDHRQKSVTPGDTLEQEAVFPAKRHSAGSANL